MLVNPKKGSQQVNIKSLHLYLKSFKMQLTQELNSNDHGVRPIIVKWELESQEENIS